MGILLDAYNSLIGSKRNKANNDNDVLDEGQAGALLPVFDVKKTDDELLVIKKSWEYNWQNSEVQKQVLSRGGICFNYWKGKQYTDQSVVDESRRPMIDNIIYESLETFLPIATRKNPEPVVSSDGTAEGEELAKTVKKMLVSLADTTRLKIQLKGQTREWAIWFIGMLEVGWDYRKNEISLKVLKSNKLIMDPSAFCENGEYNGDYLGVLQDEESCQQVIDRFDGMPGFDEEKKNILKSYVSGKLGTKLAYTKWTTNDYVFWTCKGVLLAKANNPHWNYDGEKEVTDEYGETRIVPVQGQNHFTYRQMPYIPLVVFNSGRMPVDDTSLIWQGIPLQDLINKRLKQIDRNADNVNAGSVVSGDYFTKEEAAEVGEALRKGATLYVPTGDVNVAYKRDIAPALPQYLYQSLQDYRNRFMDMFGVRGSTPSGINSEDTVRGKILSRGSDDSRIGGGITEYIEQVSDKVFNWFVQMMYVYYDEEHVASVVGAENAREYVTLKASDFNGHKLFISVREGSLIPTDDLTKRNEAIDLWQQGALDPVTLFERLDFANPREAAQKLIQWKVDPTSLIQQPEMAQTPEQQLKSAEEQKGSDIISEVPIG